MNNSIIDVGRGVDIVGQVMSKFSISLLIMTIGMIVGAMFVPPAVAIMMPDRLCGHAVGRHVCALAPA